jgi:DNA-binding XRE family transcriptional regulator
MKNDKKAKLEAAGWKVGNVSELLGLTPEESALIEMRLALSRALQNQRLNEKLTQAALAKLLGSSQSRIAKMEAADPSVSLDLLIRGLLVLGSKNTDIAQVISQT